MPVRMSCAVNEFIDSAFPCSCRRKMFAFYASDLERCFLVALMDDLVYSRSLYNLTWLVLFGHHLPPF